MQRGVVLYVERKTFAECSWQIFSSNRILRVVSGAMRWKWNPLHSWEIGHISPSVEKDYLKRPPLDQSSGKTDNHQPRNSRVLPLKEDTVQHQPHSAARDSAHLVRRACRYRGTQGKLGAMHVARCCSAIPRSVGSPVNIRRSSQIACAPLPQIDDATMPDCEIAIFARATARPGLLPPRPGFPVRSKFPRDWRNRPGADHLACKIACPPWRSVARNFQSPADL